ncbi:2-nitropropane dioxygenase family oxidoreductase [Cordyceps javanica]|nr:2-nitropropane dioxygenase family oxidoreductase [Cordyceps javanica]
MQHVGTADLASAVSNAGGLGLVTALNFRPPSKFRDEIRRCRSLTKRPFGINITMMPSIMPVDYDAYATIAIEEGVHIVETAGNTPEPVIGKLKKAGIVVIHKCTSLQHAEAAVELGADFITISGVESAAQVGESNLTNFILFSQARQRLSVPFIASGGFADGAALAAALVLGAAGIHMGTRFMTTAESPAHPNIKNTVVQAEATDTSLVLRRWRNTFRAYNNQVARRVLDIEESSETGNFEEVADLVMGRRGKEVFTSGDPERGIWTAGQVMGLIHDIPTCKELLSRMEQEAEVALQKTHLLQASPAKL